MADDLQLHARFRNVIDEARRVFDQGVSITDRNEIPDSNQIPKDDQRCWFKILDVSCVFVDMKNSTQLAVDHRAPNTAAVFQYFTDTAVRLFNEFEAPYIDVRGDGVFALFNARQVHRALAAAVTFKTFTEDNFVPATKTKVGTDLGTHIGIDRHVVMVRRVGLRRNEWRSDRQNEVWAGQPVNIAAKLASRCAHGSLLVSDRFHRELKEDASLRSCGCPSGQVTSLWQPLDLSGDSRFPFKVAQELKSRWCVKHGSDFCERLLRADAGAGAGR